MKPYQLTHKDGTEGTPAAIVWLAVLLSFVVCIVAAAIAAAL